MNILFCYKEAPRNIINRIFNKNRFLKVYSEKTIYSIMDTAKYVAPPIPFVYWFGLQNLIRHMYCREIKIKLIGVAEIAYQCL